MADDGGLSPLEWAARLLDKCNGDAREARRQTLAQIQYHERALQRLRDQHTALETIDHGR